MNRCGVRLSDAVKATVRADLAKGLNAYEINKKRGVSKTAIYRIRDEISVPPTPAPDPSDPIMLYRAEKLARAQRLAANPQMTAAQRAFAALLQREKDAGRGGRPKGAKSVNSLNGKLVKPGKPMLLALRRDPLDLTPYLGAFTGNER